LTRLVTHPTAGAIWHAGLLAFERATAHGSVAVARLCNARSDIAGRLVCYQRLVGAEVGVYRGRNAATLLHCCPLLRLYMVDLWGAPTAANGQVMQTDQRYCDEALAETEFARDRREIVQCASPQAAELVPDELDFVFVDADHRYSHCFADLVAWWPKLKPGGILFAHDFDHAAPIAKEWGVGRAVRDFAEQNKVDIEHWPDPAILCCLVRP